jgi:hypothetical protein
MAHVRREVGASCEPSSKTVSLQYTFLYTDVYRRMDIKLLRRYGHPDLSDYVIHLVGRWGMRNDEVADDIHNMTHRSRLFDGILAMGEIRAYRVFFGFGLDRVVCFTECTPAGVSAMVRDRYSPWGVAFSKDFVFRRGGGPAFYVRGDEWDDVYQLPPRLRSRCTKFWPGAVADGGELMNPALSVESQWLPEREWRVPGTGEPASLQFDPDDVAFIVVPDWESASDKYASVVINSVTGEIEDPSHVWLP